MIRFNKRNSIASLVQSSEKDAKKLFKIVNSILGRNNDNPMPPSKTDKQLTEDFASYFSEKIDKIREKFRGIPPYKPRQLDTPQLVKFTPITSSQLGRLIKRMQPKSCGLDILPTSKLQ